MASLFISYSRRDVDVARRLTEAFKGQNLDFWIDWEGIDPTVDWWMAIEKGIEEADVFLFLISPDSCKSRVCEKELLHAVKNGKRLVPIVVRGQSSIQMVKACLIVNFKWMNVSNGIAIEIDGFFKFPMQLLGHA